MTHDTRTASAEPVHNEAAERLQTWILNELDLDEAIDTSPVEWLHAALAAEHRATVERISDNVQRIAAAGTHSPMTQAYREAVRSILVEEAAR